MARSTPTHDITATIGEYTDRRTGEKKKRYLKVGTAFTAPDGRVSLKIDAMPVSPEWSGWLSLYPIYGDSAPSQEKARPAQSAPEPATNYHEDDEIPF